VWGATFFARLLGGEGLRAAMTEANRLAGLNVDHRAAAGLVTHFSTRSEPGNSRPGERMTD
jgi:hypothetical protein